MTPFRANGRKAYKVRLVLPDGRKRVCGTDTYSKPVADAMERWARGLRYGADRRMDVLEAIVTGRVPLPVAYDRRRELDRLMAEVNDLDLRPYLESFEAAKAKARKGAGSAAKYRTQIETLLRDGQPFFRSQFTTARVRRHLAELPCDDATRNRYKAAFSAFARYLVDHDIIERNVVRDIPGWPVGEPRDAHYSMTDAGAVIQALPQPFRAIEALMLATGMEWQAIERLRRADVNLEARTVDAGGSKTHWRNRSCKLLEIFDWCVPMIEPALRGLLPAAPVFPDLQHRRALEQHLAACTAAKVPRTRLHDWRHTHAVLALKAGYPLQGVAHQLGHKDASMVLRVYGKYIPSRDEMLPNVTPGQEKAAGKQGRKAVSK